jgi:C4-dicarboxylate transporter DctM subunit
MKSLRLIDQYLEEALCTLSLLILASSVFLQVVLRFVFGSAVAWAEETAVLGMITAVYFGAVLATRERAHIRITVLVNLLPRPFQIACILIADIMWFGFVLFLLVQTVEYTKLLFNVTYLLPGLGVEQRWFQLIIPIALAMMLFRISQVYHQWMQDGWKGLPL